MIRLAAVFIWCLAASGATWAATSCAGHPRLKLTVPAGWCMGLVADGSDGLRMPRRLLEVAPGRFWLTDMGSWDAGKGRLLEVRTDGSATGAARVRVLAHGLNRPHGLQRGPDGQAYVAEADGVWRTPVGEAVQREDVVKFLPDQGSHPLKEIAFGDGGSLYINLGSASDDCQGAWPCPDAAGPMPRAAVLEAKLGGPRLTLQTLKPYATGLRNSLGLAVGPGGQLWQAENSVDYPEASEPAEELNLLSPGSQHGWPACVSDARGRSMSARASKAGAAVCTPATAPYMAWPAHAAPLQLLFPPAPTNGQPATPWAGKLLAVWHGYRATGHRVVAWALGADGKPMGARQDIVSGWGSVPGQRGPGAPAGATVDHRGWLWLVDDRNHLLLVLAPASASTTAVP
ncbi:MAG: PQQ-dependent sugar dehydrogenase [Vitreoscilla sp.]|nr:PQQ-dependent sugar dehydrogenase [Vitreoscilla sp.]MBP6676240.1 PQQ-dependent sugar dehydrogenase [Vitreoscilla sp.]